MDLRHLKSICRSRVKCPPTALRYGQRALSLVCVLLGLGVWLAGFAAWPTDVVSVGSIEGASAIAHVALPADARIVEAGYHKQFECVLYCVLLMTEEDLNAVLRQNPSSDVQPADQSPMIFGAQTARALGMKQWAPELVADGLSIEVHTMGYPRRYVWLVADCAGAEGNVTMVYVQAGTE